MIHDHRFPRPSRFKRALTVIEDAQESGAYWPSMVVILTVSALSWAGFFWVAFS